MFVRALAVATCMLLAAGCCPIPVPDDIMVFPAASLVVRDATDAPVAGARILVHAESQPHAKDDDPTIELASDAEGRATLTERIDDTVSYPLMMHGVGAYSWSWCVDHPVHGLATKLDRIGYDNQTELVARFDGTQGTCVIEPRGLGTKAPEPAPDPKK
jgi:hypothetical protein